MFRCTPLHIAHSLGELNIPMLLLKGGPDASAIPIPGGHTPLEVASKRDGLHDHVTLIRLLIASGATDDDPTLIRSVVFGCFASLRELLKAGANVNVLDLHGSTTSHQRAPSELKAFVLRNYC